MSLMDANYTADEHLASRSLSLTPLPVGQQIKKTIQFNETSEVDFEIWGEVKDQPSDLRFSLTLCKEEKNFLEVRKRKICKMMKEYYGFAAPRNYREVPVIGIIGSGGGFRAMTAFSGVFSALSEIGILDMATYVGGLSGSAWYLSQLYSHPEWPIISPKEQREEIQHNIDSNFMWLFKSHGLTFAKEVWKKRSRGEPVSFTDLFGHLVGNTLLKNRLDVKLSDQRVTVNEGLCPLPLYTCLHVKKCVSAMIFHEWMEFSPYEVGLPKYGTFMKSEEFACKFFMGNIVRRFPEPPLHFLQGIWGSAFCIQFKRLLQDDKNVDSTELMRREREELAEELEKDMQEYDAGDSESSDEEPMNEKGTHGEKTTGGLQRKRSKSTKLKQKTYWERLLARMMESSWFQTIELRAAQVFNFMRGLSLNNVFPFSPFTQTQEEEDENNKATFGSIFDLHPTDIKKLYVVDSGLTFNSPFPVMLRPQREVDIILSFDFSARPSDDTPPFKELLLAAKWAELNKVPFPPIDPTVVEREGLKECYVFKHPWDPNCPIVLHFCLININFKREIRPGLARRTQEELDFGNFSVFDDPARPYSTFKFTYTHQEFQRLSQLMEYNTLLCRDIIYDNIKVCIKRRRRFSIRRPCKKNDIARLSLNSRVKAEKLLEYINMVEAVNREAQKEDKDHIDGGAVKSARPSSSPVFFPEEGGRGGGGREGDDHDQVEIRNPKLQRSTVSLRANMRNRNKRLDLPNMDEVDEGVEEQDESSSDSSSSRHHPPANGKKTLSRSRPVSASMKASFDMASDKDDKHKIPAMIENLRIARKDTINDENGNTQNGSSSSERAKSPNLTQTTDNQAGSPHHAALPAESNGESSNSSNGKSNNNSGEAANSSNGRHERARNSFPDIVVMARKASADQTEHDVNPLEKWIDAAERVTDL